MWLRGRWKKRDWFYVTWPLSKKKNLLYKRNSERTKKKEQACFGWCSPCVRCFGWLKRLPRDLFVELLCFLAGSCNGFSSHMQHTSSLKYIVFSNNTDLETVSSCTDCTSICLPRRWVAKTVWVDKMTYYHCKSFYFIVWWPSCGSGSQLDRKLCSL